MSAIPVYLEVGRRRVFAAAMAWPGWCRAARDEEGALAALRTYTPRYAAVVSGLRVDRGGLGRLSDLEVIERLEGDATTDFGAPGAVPTADREPLEEPELSRLIAILEATWKAFDATALAAQGMELRKGPRGGGRDLPAIIGHVDGADVAYLRSLGSREPSAGELSHADQRAEVRRRSLAAVGARARGEPLEHPREARAPWLPRTYIRRAAWHALDHAWEIEDRLLPAG